MLDKIKSSNIWEIDQKINPIARLFITWYVFIFFSTEILSYFSILSHTNIILFNIIFALLLIKFNYKDIKYTFVSSKHFLSEAIFVLGEKARKRNLFYTIILILLGLTFIQGFFSAPSTTDSMTYHITRIMYWIQEGTVAQSYIRNSHDFMPPFAEYILTHLYLIVGNDNLLFLSQWLSYVGSIYLSGVIAGQMRASYRTRNLVRIFIATLPIAVMQASSTQVDLVTTLITLILMHISLFFYVRPSLRLAVILGVVLGLGMLIKTPFILGAFVPLAVLSILILAKKQKAVMLLFLTLIIALVMQNRYYSQNIKLYGNITGQHFSGSKNTYVNEIFTPSVLISNVVRNIMNQLPVPILTPIAQQVLVGVHNLIGLDISDPRTSYFEHEFSVLPVVYPQEDIVSSPIHMILILGALVILLIKGLVIKKNEGFLMVQLYFLFLILSFLIFSFILKWEPYHPRLQIASFAIGIIIALLVLEKIGGYQKFTLLLVALAVPIAFLVSIFNVSRPYISYSYFYNHIKSFSTPLSDIPETFYLRERNRQYFNSRPYWYESYKQVIDLYSQQTNKKVVLNLMDDEFEYPLWVLAKENKTNPRFLSKNYLEHGDVIITTAPTPYEKEGFKTDCFKTRIAYGYACISIKED